MKKIWLRSLAAAMALAPAATAAAGWQSLGAMPAPECEATTLRFRNGQGVVAVSVLAPGIIRVRFSPTAGFGRDHSYAVTGTEPGQTSARLSVGQRESTILTSELRVTIRHDPFRLGFATAAGESLHEDDAERGMAFAGTQVKAWTRLRDDEHVYGFGEKNGRLDKRGRMLGGYSYAMWNSNTYAYDSDTDPIYASVPFFMVMRKGQAHGIFLDNTFRTTFEVGRESPSLLSFGAEAGELNYYFINGPHPKRVLERYTALTGRTPLPPLWALGFHQCRYSYYPESKVREVADSFRSRRIPADAIWLDIHYLDDYKPFTWNRERFPDPARMIADLRSEGFRVVTVLDPHPAREPGTVPYDTGLAGGHFVKNADGSVYEAPVWPARGERDPRPSVFPDFSRPATREWWGSLHEKLLDVGVAGIWNDMNEPAIFQTGTGTLPLDVRHDNEGETSDHRELHNVYGQLMTRATHEGLLRLRPQQRPFVLTRATFAGGQRYAAIWSGDTQSDWTHLRASLPQLMGMGLSGFAFAGSDIGGFAHGPSAELFSRWLQAGVFYPFMRAHSNIGTPDQEPWSYGTRHEAINRRAIELRYQLLPQVYDVMQQASETGVPAMRPLFLEYPEDESTYSLDDQFLFGRDLLIAPVLREGATERRLYLPAGEWYDFWSGASRAGGRAITVPVTIDSLPLFVRAGAFVFRQPVMQHTGERVGQPLEVYVYPAEHSVGRHYEDDGESLSYRSGVYLERKFEQRREGRRVTIDAGAPRGTYRPAARELRLIIRAEDEPARVRVGGAVLPRLLPPAGAGWEIRDGFVVVRMPDRFGPFRVTLEP